HAAVLAAQRGRAVPRPVDGRSDVYSLGLVLYEALGGILPALTETLTSVTRFDGVRGTRDGRRTDEKPQPLHRANPRVSVGLADVIAHCLADDPRDRYPTMAALAADLRRHLAHRPLLGVRNRSLAERWSKWRRRRPYGSILAG